MSNIDKHNKANSLMNKKLCNFIADKFLRAFYDKDGSKISQNKYASQCGLSSSTISKIKSNSGYDMPISTIYNICRREEYSLKKLFTEFEDLYGENFPL